MSYRIQNQLRWYLHVVLCVAMLAPIVHPLFGQSDGWLPPADPTLQTVPEYQDDGRGAHMPFGLADEEGLSKAPSFTLSADVAEISELIPTHLISTTAVYDEKEQAEIALVTTQGGAVSFLDGRVTIIADANSFAEPVTLALKPHFQAEQKEEITPIEPPSPAEEILPVAEIEPSEEASQIETPSSAEETLPLEEERPIDKDDRQSEASEPVAEHTPAATTSLDGDEGGLLLPAPNPYPYEWLQFEIEALSTTDGQPIPLFDTQLYIVIDLREMYPEVLGQGWFISFQDEEDPALWHYTPLTIHDEEGLFSTTTDHFSTWNAGYQPSAWRYQWNVPAVSAFSGAATFNYPIEVPAGRGGLTPNIDISYSSRGVDTLIFSDGMDQMPLGLGWNINNIEITRDNPHPKDDGAHVFMQHPARFSLVFNGNSYQLEKMTDINHATTVVRYYAINNPSLKIEQISNNSAGNADKLYWQVIDGSGTVYRLGYTADAESHHRNFIDVWGTNPQQPLQQLAGATGDYSGIRWRVDMITDVHGNQIQYSYITSSQIESYESTSGIWTYVTTTSSRIREIRYNYENLASNANTEVAGIYASRILFEPAGYLPVNQINLYQVDLSTPYQRIRIGTSAHVHGNEDCGQGGRPNRTGVVDWIRQEDGNGTLYLPQTNFSYWVASNGTHNGNCFRFARLQEVNNGYGGRIRFSYDTDNRIEDWWHWGLNRPPAYGRTFFVTQAQTWDGIHTNPAVTEYQYQTPCYDQYGAVGSGLGTLPNAFNCPTRPNAYGHNRYGHGKLIGFNTATVTQRDYNGQILRRTDTAFHQDNRKTGWPSWQEVRDPNGFVLQKQETTYSQDFAANQFDFSFASQVKNTQYVRGGESTHHTISYEYARQNNIQYGNLTAIREIGYIGGIGNNERHVLRDYYPNTGAWIVSAVARERVLGPSNALQAETRNFYDGSSSWNAVPTKGNLTTVSKLKDLPSTFITVQSIELYDSYGNVRKIRDGRSNLTEIAYDSTFNLLPVTITNAANHTQQIQYFGFHGVPNQTNHAGLVKQVTDANNNTTSYEYDPFRRLVKVIRPAGDTSASPSEVYTYYDYGSQRLTAGPFMISSWTKTQNNATPYTTGGVFERNFYDGFGNVVQTQRPHTNWNGGGVGQEVVVDMEYNALGQMIWQNSPYLRNAYTYGTTNGFVNNPYNTPNLSQPRVSHTYNALGQTVRSVNLDGGVSSAVHGYRSTYTQDANFNVKAAYTDLVGQLVAVDEMLTRYSDTFDNTALPNWTKSGSVSVTGGVVRLTGNNDWNTYILRQLNYAGENEDGVAFSFRTSHANATATILLDYGTWNTSNYRRWAIMLTGSNLILQEYTGSGITNNQTLMPAKANTWYRVMLIKGRPGINHRLVVWEQDNPAIFAEVRLAKDSSWQQDNWRFVANMYTSGATLDIDNYAQFKVYRTSYKYDLLGNLKEVVDPLNNKTEMWYDALGRKTSMRDPDMGHWTYDYDAVGNLTTQRDAKGQRLCFTYDNLNRLTHKRQDSNNNGCETTDTQLARYTYVTAGNGLGQISGIYWGSSSTQNYETFGYDTFGRVVSHMRRVDSRSYTMQYTYDSLSRPETIQTPNNEIIALTYDRMGLETMKAGNNFIVTSINHNVRGQIQSIGRGTSAIPNIYYTYHGATDDTGGGLGDSNYRLKAISYALTNNPTPTPTGDIYPDFTYQYDRLGNITRIDTQSSAWTDTQIFTYDSLHRLENAHATGGQANYSHNSDTTRYRYNPLGNITHLGNNTPYNYTTTSANCPTPPPHAMPHAVKQVGSNYYCYDHNGNMTRRHESGITYTQNFNVENELANVVVNGQMTSFTYDASGIRVKTVKPNGDVIYTPFPNYEEEVRGATTIKRTIYSAAGQPLATRVVGDPSNSGLFYLTNDHLGSSVMLVNSAGGVVAGSTTRYQPFGAYRGAVPTQAVTELGYTSHRENMELGLVYMNARYYVPGLGRFASADTIVPDPTNPQQFNRFAYVLNNPIRLTDPTGHYCYDSTGGGMAGTCMDDGSTPPQTSNPYIINPKEYEAIILVGLNSIPSVTDDLTRIRTMVVNYQTNFGTLGKQASGVASNVIIIYYVALANLTNRAGGKAEPYARSSWDAVSELDLLARILAAEAGSIGTLSSNQAEMVGIAQVVFNRLAQNSNYRNVRGVLLNGHMFAFTLNHTQDDVRDSRVQSERWANPLGHPSNHSYYRQALAIAVGVNQGWLSDPRTANAYYISGANGVTTFSPGGVVRGYPSLPRYLPH